MEIECRVRGGLSRSVFEAVLAQLHLERWVCTGTEEVRDVQYKGAPHVRATFRGGGGSGGSEGAPGGKEGAAAGAAAVAELATYVRKAKIEEPVDAELVDPGTGRAVSFRLSCSSEQPLSAAPCGGAEGLAVQLVRHKVRHSFSAGDLQLDLTEVRTGGGAGAAVAALGYEAEVEWRGQCAAQRGEYEPLGGARHMSQKFMERLACLARLVAAAGGGSAAGAHGDAAAAATDASSHHHPRSPYSQPLDFPALAARDARLLPYLPPPGGHYNFKDPCALAALSAALLHAHWGVPSWKCPRERLCPTIPSRLNYVLWVQDLLAARMRGWAFLPDCHHHHHHHHHSSSSSSCSILPLQEEVGIDVGTGAGAVLPLLCSAACGLNIVGTEVDALSAASAGLNVASAGEVGRRIKVVRILLPPACSAASDSSSSSSSSSSAAVPGDVQELCTDGLLRDVLRYTSAAVFFPAAGPPPCASCTSTSTSSITDGAAPPPASPHLPPPSLRCNSSVLAPPAPPPAPLHSSGSSDLRWGEGESGGGGGSSSHHPLPQQQPPSASLPPVALAAWQALHSWLCPVCYSCSCGCRAVARGGDGGGSSASSSTCSTCSSSSSRRRRAGYSFSLCNPPFFSTLEEAQASMQGKADSAATGSPVELVCEGGEEAFVRRLMAESCCRRQETEEGGGGARGRMQCSPPGSPAPQSAWRTWQGGWGREW